MTNQEQYELICEKAKKYDRLIEILDKIKEEIIWYRDNRLSDEANSETIELTNYYLGIIDKYKTKEMEGSEE